MTPRVTRRTVMISASLLVLLALAFGAGAWVGADWVGRFYGYQALPRANASATMLHRKLVLLDSADTAGLREGINMELDGELLGMCTLVKERSGSSSDAIATARTILRRIAMYRTVRPPSYPTAYASQVDATAKKSIQGCLDEAVAASVP